MIARILRRLLELAREESPRNISRADANARLRKVLREHAKAKHA